jgi:predicted ATPase
MMRAIDAKHYLLSASILWDRVENRDAYPFGLAAVRALDGLEFHPKVTFFVGENGSGESTILEALAVAWGFNPEGGSKAFNFATYASHSELHKALRLLKGVRRAKDGYFLRAESYFNVATTIAINDREPGPGRRIIDAYGGKSLHEQSHGESFLALLENRLHGNGLYILDEPEAALSPTRQMSMLTRMHDLIGKNAQFVIATHSPIIMSYPDAVIFRLDQRGIERVDYEDTEHFQVTRDFLNRRETMLDMLLKE